MTDPTSSPRLRTRGLNHVNLVVADVDRARRFYETALGYEYLSTGTGITFLTTPGVGDLLSLQQSGGDLDRLAAKDRVPGDMGGVDHIGFAVDPESIEQLVGAVEAAGGTTVLRTTDSAGRPVVFVTDVDGYLLQLG